MIRPAPEPFTDLEGAAVAVLLKRIKAVGAAIMIVNAHSAESNELEGAVVLVNGKETVAAFTMLIAEIFAQASMTKTDVVH